MLLRKEQGGVTIGDWTWEHDGDAVDVPDHIAADLLAIRGGGFSVADGTAAPAAPADPPADPPKAPAKPMTAADAPAPATPTPTK
jgi:hypothetical protein